MTTSTVGFTLATAGFLVCLEICLTYAICRPLQINNADVFC